MIGISRVPVVPSGAVALKVAVPALSAWNTPLSSIVAIDGVSASHVIVGDVTVPLIDSLAKSCDSKPTGSGASFAGSRPEKTRVLVGGGSATGPPQALTEPKSFVAATLQVLE